MSSSIISETYALVTGGSSGIGLAFVHQLAARGYNILIVSNEREKLAALELEIENEYDVRTNSLFIDLAEDNAAQNIYDFCNNKKLNIEVLINNAGVLIADNFMDVAPERIVTLLKLHTVSTTLLCRLFAKNMIAMGKGYILNVSSTSAFMPYPLISVYGPSKTYIRNFTKALHNELYHKNIFVSCILPGAVDTNLYHLSPSYVSLARRFGIMHSPYFIAKEGLKIMFKNKGESVPGFLNRLSLVLIKLVPDFVIRRILQSWNKSE